MVDHLKSVKDSADLRAAVEEVQVHDLSFLLFVLGPNLSFLAKQLT